jgi:glutamyl-Q tRNA(Asp) synthetase
VTPTFRFAPSPNGRLHLGHALSAITGFEMARRSGGRFLVRIEDIDTGRSRPELIDAIFADLEWLGLSWEQPVLRQSEHFDVYRAAAARLQAEGLLYPCFASRTEIAVALPATATLDPDGAPIYPGLHKDLAASEIATRRARGEPNALRIDMPRAIARAMALSGGAPLSFTAVDGEGRQAQVAVDPMRWGDAVIVRKDVPASYHLACVVDDARQGVSHVTRGLDLLAATDIHVLLQVLLGLPRPLYHHHRLLVDDQGRKLAKSAGDTSLGTLRAAGATRSDIRRIIGLAS